MFAMRLFSFLDYLCFLGSWHYVSSDSHLVRNSHNSVDEYIFTNGPKEGFLLIYFNSTWI